MCGIIGYIGPKNGTEIVIEGLKSLEYRGYDSWGVAVKTNPSIAIEKQAGKISNFNNLGTIPESSIAIGHTRWSTHGASTKENAHPHTCCKKEIAIVHNGIIENFQELKKELTHHTFTSETDTEIIAHLIEDNIKFGYDFETAFKKAMTKLQGRFAVVAISEKNNRIIATKKGSPLVIGVGKNEYFVASDVPAFLKYTNNVIFLEDGDVVSVKSDLDITDFKDRKVERLPTKIEWNLETAELGEFPHFMIKEIMEQKDTIMRAVNQPDEKIKHIADMINLSPKVFFIGCGTAGKVAQIGSYLFSKIAKKRVSFVIGSEFPNYHDFLGKSTLLLSISQSGETADTLEAMEICQKARGKLISVVNVMGSTIQRISDEFLMCNCGPEKAVASTKATTSQIAILTLLAYASAGKLEEGKAKLEAAAHSINTWLDNGMTTKIKSLAKKIAGHESMYLIGRSLNFPIALEAAIKMQEVPYIHAEGFAGGELKHGPIALIQNGTPCVAFIANDENKSDMISNTMEIRSRGGFIIGVAPENNEIFDFHIEVPDVGNASPIANLIPIQLLSYYTTLERGYDPDKPRNLAKSVTVK
ncbi:glutamine--fructose-6-phosphate transaminase (isomerizing) [Nanoarchaeota archaeon]